MLAQLLDVFSSIGPAPRQVHSFFVRLQLAMRRSLHSNQLTGTVPSELGALTRLSDLCVRGDGVHDDKSLGRGLVHLN